MRNGRICWSGLALKSIQPREELERMKVATGVLMLRSRGTSWLSVSVPDLKRSLRGKSSTLTK